MDFIAHTKNEDGREHKLSNHLFEVASKMSNITNNVETNLIFRIAGLLHDLGKYQIRFQKYLKEGGHKGSVPHASCGAAIAKRYKLYEAAFAIDGHHKGLPDLADLKDDIAAF